MGLKIINAASDRPSIALYGTIGDEFGGITADQLRSAVNQIPKNRSFDLHIYSDGGSFFEAMAMHAVLSAHRGKVRAIVDGLAASSASLLLQAASDRVMSKHSRQMMHEARGRSLAFMTADKFREMAAQVESLNDEITRIYSEKWKGTEKELKDALATDYWMTAEEAVEKGLADSVGEGMAIAARVNTDYFAYSNVPEDVKLESGPFEPPAEHSHTELFEAAFAGLDLQNLERSVA